MLMRRQPQSMESLFQPPRCTGSLLSSIDTSQSKQQSTNVRAMCTMCIDNSWHETRRERRAQAESVMASITCYNQSTVCFVIPGPEPSPIPVKSYLIRGHARFPARSPSRPEPDELSQEIASKFKNRQNEGRSCVQHSLPFFLRSHPLRTFISVNQCNPVSTPLSRSTRNVRLFRNGVHLSHLGRINSPKATPRYYLPRDNVYNHFCRLNG